MKNKTEVEILRDALVSIAKNDEIWRDAVNECLRIADKAKTQMFTIEELEKLVWESIHILANSTFADPNIVLTGWLEQKKKQLLSNEGRDES